MNYSITTVRTRCRRFVSLLHSQSSVSRAASSHIYRAQHSSYHSYHHPAPLPYTEVSGSILKAAIAHVPEHGFTASSLRLGAKDLNYLQISTNLFPQGVFDLIMYWLASRRLALHDAVNGERGLAKTWNESKTPIGARVRALLLERLRMNGEAGINRKWSEALAIMAQPSYVPQAVAELGRLSDDIWFLAGDTSVDTSWYTKRATLSALYAASELHQTQDTSIDFMDTTRFVDSRLAELAAARMASESVSEWLSFSGHSLLNVLRSKGAQI